MGYDKLFVISALLGAVTVSTWTAFTWAEDVEKATRQTPYQRDRKMLPDYSEGRCGLLGPFYWGRGMDLGEDARFSDANGRASHDGEHLWMFQYARTHHKGLPKPIHARSNFISTRRQLSYTVQPKHFILNTAGAHNAKIIFGYVEQDFRFLNADNCDLAHLADTDRVVVFFPVRHSQANGQFDPLDQGIYYVNPHYGAQAPCVIEFKAGEMIRYEYFRNPRKLDKRILYDLQPHFSGDKALRPGVTHPMLRFDLHDKGGWTLRLERDGRDGLSGGDDPHGWDLVVTHESDGAKPYSVGLKPGSSRWAMSLFSPGGSPMETSEVLLKLTPYDRVTGKTADWHNRRRRVRSEKVEKVEKLVAGDKAPRK
ncbi:MAG: hypothetical protein ACLFV7_12485 [Phycisphaerae bacterium]